jgi:hypothetical protein
MPRYRFAAADADGMLHDGTIDAASLADARHKLASNGLAVRELEEVEGTAGMVPPEVPRRHAPKPAAKPAADADPLPTRPPRREPPAESPRRGSRATLVLSVIALFLSLTAVAYVVYRDPPWGRLSKYDFRTPEAAYTSQVRMAANGDYLAMMELQRKLNNKQIRQRLDTLRIDHTRQAGGKTVVFAEYYDKEKPQREVAVFEKDPDSGMWKQSYSAMSELMHADPRLAQEIREWTSGRTGVGEGVFPGGAID